MPLRVCIECGASVPDLRAQCPKCQARSPAWRAVPIGIREVGRRLVVGAALLALVANSAWAFHLVLTRWQSPPPPLDVVRVGVGGLLLILMVVAAYLAFRETFQRQYLHDEGERRGKAWALFGVLIQGEGQAFRPDAAFVPETPSLGGVEVFASMRTIHRMLAKVLRAPSQPKAVDTAVMAAFLGLAARRRIELVPCTSRQWEKRFELSAVYRYTEALVVTVRSIEARDLAPEDGWLEHALLSVVDGGRAAAPPARPGAATGPYRKGRSVAPAVENPAGEPVRVDAVVAALTEGQRRPRAYLQEILRAEAARIEARPGIAERYGEELASAIRRRKRGPGRALLAGIEEALADRDGAPPPTPRA